MVSSGWSFIIKVVFLQVFLLSHCACDLHVFLFKKLNWSIQSHPIGSFGLISEHFLATRIHKYVTPDLKFGPFYFLSLYSIN